MSLFDRIRAVRARGPQPAPPTASAEAKLIRISIAAEVTRRKPRGLNASERAAAEEVFGNTIHVPIDHYVRRDERGYRIDNLET